MDATTTVQCPSCDTDFRIDPAKVPEGGVRTQCTVCGTMFRVDPPEAEPWVSEDPLEGAFLTEGETGAAEPLEAMEAGEPGAVAEAEEAPFEAAVEAAPTFEAEEGPTFEAEAEEGPGFEAETEEEPTFEAETEEEPTFEAEAGPALGAPAEAEPEPEEASASSEDWSTSLGDDWVLETEDASAFGEVDVDRLDTVEEQMRSAKEEEIEPADGIDQVVLPGAEEDTFSGYTAADEIVLSDADLDAPVGEMAPDEAPLDVGFESPVSEEEGQEIGTVEAAGAEAAPELDETAAEAPPEVEEPAPAAPAFQFGKRDPHDKARRLARVLVSDMITYNPERHARALEGGTLKVDFEEEIEKSWAEYVEQIGTDLAESTDYWTDALNEILAKGEPLF